MKREYTVYIKILVETQQQQKRYIYKMNKINRDFWPQLYEIRATGAIKCRLKTLFHPLRKKLRPFYIYI